MKVTSPHTDVDIEDLAVGLVSYNDYESLVALVVALERHIGDSVFTDLLDAALDELRQV